MSNLSDWSIFIVFVSRDSFVGETVTEGIGAFLTFINKTSTHQPSAKGKGISDANVSLEALFFFKPSVT